MTEHGSPTDSKGATDGHNEKERPNDTSDPLLELLAPEARLKLLVAFIRLGGTPANPASLCERAGVDRTTWYRHRDTLLDTYGVIEDAGRAGNSPLYRIDEDDPIVERLCEVSEHADDRRTS